MRLQVGKIVCGFYALNVLCILLVSRADRTGRSENSIKQNILHNLPKDIKRALKSGKTREEVMNYYWGVRLWREMFYRLGWDRNTMFNMVYKK